MGCRDLATQKRGLFLREEKPFGEKSLSGVGGKASLQPTPMSLIDPTGSNVVGRSDISMDGWEPMSKRYICYHIVLDADYVAYTVEKTESHDLSLFGVQWGSITHPTKRHHTFGAIRGVKAPVLVEDAPCF